MGRRRWIVVAAVVALLGAGAGAVSFAVPGLAATACPGCYGLHDLGDHVYADTADPRLRDVVAAADRRIAAFYGERRSDPRVLICADRCRLPYEQALPVTTADWWSLAADGDDRAYLQAACVVSRWAGQHGGAAGVLDLISRLRDGEAFADLVRP